jgi:hypothetical protein
MFSRALAAAILVVLAAFPAAIHGAAGARGDRPGPAATADPVC